MYNLNKWDFFIYLFFLLTMEDECKEASVTQITALIAPITQVPCHASPVLCICNISHLH